MHSSRIEFAAGPVGGGGRQVWGRREGGGGRPAGNHPNPKLRMHVKTVNKIIGKKDTSQTTLSN